MTDFSRREIVACMTAGGLLARSASCALPASHTVFGVNTYDIFLAGIHPNGKFGTEILGILGRLGVPFARFAASAQWAGDWAVYDEKPIFYWSGMDMIFAAAEQNGVKLVPSVFWNPVALAYYLGEPIGSWADPKSKVSVFAERYTAEFVERYDGSPALLMYEFLNELNDYVDDIDRLKFWPKQDPALPDRKPTGDDLLSSVDLRSMSQRFAQAIGKASSIPIGMGSNVPRGYAWHMARGRKQLDTRTQFIQQLRSITPPEMKVLSIHLYDRLWPWPIAPSTIAEVLYAFVEAAKLDKRISFLGEFGVQRMSDRKEEIGKFMRRIEQIKVSSVSYAAIWNVSLKRFQPEWDVIPNGDRGYQLECIIAANRKMTS